MKNLYSFLIAAVFLWAGSICCCEEPLNLMVIIADDCTFTDTEVYGGQAKTPHMVKLASEGMKFNKCFQSAPMCSPTRHSLYTSLYPVKSGAWPNHTYVYDGVESVAHHLSKAGYRVALSGKTHINPPEAFPFEYSRFKENRSTNPDFKAVETLLSECRQSKTPFGLLLCSNEPHGPWNQGDPSIYDSQKLKLPPIYVDTQELRSEFPKYLAEITYFDSQVGQALALLEKYDMRDNTLVVVLTEQGNSLPFAKWTCFDKGLASGLIIRWPGRTNPGSTSEALVEYVDIIPTFMAAAGLDVPENLDGKSFTEVLLGAKASHKEYAFGLQTTRGIINGSDHYGIRSVRDTRYRYILNLSSDMKFSDAFMRGAIWESWNAAAKSGSAHAEFLVNKYQYRPAVELYDCINDPWNLKNLADDPNYSETRTRLRSKLDGWMKSQGDQGAATELAASKRLWRNRNKNR